MGRFLIGAAGTLFGAASLAASGTPINAGGGWLPTLGSFALGGLLGALFGNSGFTVAFILTVVTIVAMLAVRIFVKPNDEPVAPPVFAAGLGNQPATPAPAKGGGLDADSLLHTAKLDFVKLKLAGELCSLERVRDLTTTEVYAGLRATKAELVSLNAELVKMVTQGDRNLASVRFSGTLRETPGSEPVGFEEFWSLSKSQDGASGWLLAGIRQTH